MHRKVAQEEERPRKSASLVPVGRAMQEIEVEEGSQVVNLERVRKAYDALGGDAEPMVAPIVRADAKVCGEYLSWLQVAPFAEGVKPDPCKTFLFKDALVVGLDRKKCHRGSRAPRTGIIDSAAFRGTITVDRAALAPRKKRGPYKLLYYFDLRRCHVKHTPGSSAVHVRYVLRTKLPAADGARRFVTRIATLQLDFGDVDLCQAFREDIEGCISRLNVPSRSSVSSLGSGSRRTWSRRISAAPVPRRRQVVSETYSSERTSVPSGSLQGSRASMPEKQTPRTSVNAVRMLSTLRRFSAQRRGPAAAASRPASSPAP